MDTKCVTIDDLMQRTGGAVTRRQIERWQKAGLLPSPHRRGLGRGKGTVSEYPEIAIAMVKELLTLSARSRDIHAWRWQLWLDGFPIDHKRFRAALIHQVDAVQDEFDGRRTSEEYEDELAIVEALVADVMPSLRRRLPREMRSRTPASDILRSMMIWGFSTFLGYEPPVGWLESVEDDEQSIKAAVLQMVGLPADTEEPGGVNPTAWLSLPALRNALVTASEDEWCRSRQDWLAVSDVIAALEAINQLQPLPQAGQFAIALGNNHLVQSIVTAFLIEARRSPLANNIQTFMTALRGIALTIGEPSRPLERSEGVAQGREPSSCDPMIPKTNSSATASSETLY